MNYQLKRHEYDFDIVFNEFLLKYFDPTEVKIDYIGVKSWVKGKSDEQYALESMQARLASRWCCHDFYTLSYINETEVEIFHPDYDVSKYASRVLFKMELSDLNEDDLKDVEVFVFWMKELIMLYTADQWHEVYSKMNTENTGTIVFYDAQNIKALRLTLEKLENIDKSEIFFRKKDANNNVMTSETQKLDDKELEMFLSLFAKQKYYEFIYGFNAFAHLPTDERAEIKSNILNIPTYIRSLSNDDVAFTIDILSTMHDVKPSFTSGYFKILEDHVSSLLVNNKIDPLYEYLKLLVPRLNKAIEENADTTYRKKDKHLLLFSLLRSANLLPDKETLGLEGDTDVKEDFIKQLLR